MKKVLVFALIFSFFSFSTVMGQKTARKNPSTAEIYSLFQNPPMQYRPMVRWWWNGNKVTAKEVVRELHVLKEAGIGGVEINPIEFPTHGDQDMGIPALPWLSDEWIDVLKVALDTAKALGMTTDLIVGSGWPYGGEYLPEKDRAQLVVNYTKKIAGPMHLEVSEDALFAMADPKISSPFMGRKMELMRLILVQTPCTDFNSCIELTANKKDGTYSYDVPAGNYTLAAVVKINGFLKVIDGSLGANGPVVDHYNSEAVLRYLVRMSSTIEQRMGALRQYLRAFFTDSMELEGSNWSDDIAAEFKARRGYDVRPYLPFILYVTGGMGNVSSYAPPIEVSDSLSKIVNRVRYDFETTKAELLSERFLSVYADWAASLGVKSRAQAYGRGFFPLESSMYMDIPEGESWTTNFLKHRPGEEMSETDYRRGRAYTMIDKYVSSAAHLSGKQLVSCEEMTNTYKVFNMTLQELKLGGDQTVSTGITHSIFHGFNYSPPEIPFPGWIRYGAYYNENNPWWPYFHLYNDYKARLYSVLQNCENVADIAILTPTADMWSSMGMQNEPFPSNINAPYQTLVWEAIVKNGGSCDYVSEKILRESRMEKGMLCYGKRRYHTLFLVNVESISAETAVQLQCFVACGGRLVCVETEPFQSLGMHADNAAEDSKVKTCMDTIRQQYPDRYVFVKKPESDFIGWYRNLQEKYNFSHAMTIADPNPYLMQIHYRTVDGNDVFFIAHTHRYQSYTAHLSFAPEITKGKVMYSWNLETGERQEVCADLNFGPASSYLIVFEKKHKVVRPLPKSTFNSSLSWTQLDDWEVELLHCQEPQVRQLHLDKLQDISKLDSAFAGTIVYRCGLSIEKSGRLLLDLGRVEGISECYVNGQKVGLRWYGKHTYEVPESFVKKGNNKLEIRVITTLGNYMKTLADNPVAQYWTNKWTKNQPICSWGILGPVLWTIENYRAE